jgi:hypothetical protein
VAVAQHDPAVNRHRVKRTSLLRLIALLLALFNSSEPWIPHGKGVSRIQNKNQGH